MPTLSQPYPNPVAVRDIHYDQDFPLMFGGTGAWQVYSHAAVQQVLYDYEHFSNAYMPQGPDYLIGSNLNQTDPPLHPKLRTLIIPFFTRTAIADRQENIRNQVLHLLTPLLSRGEAEFASDLAFPLSAGVICSIIGIPDHAYPLVNDWAKAIVNAGYEAGGLERAAAAQQQMLSFFTTLLAERMAIPQNDLLSHMLQASLDNEAVPMPIIIATLMTLLLAGHETTASLMISAVHVLTELPDWQARLQKEPGLSAAFLLELLRLRPALASMYRKARKEITLEGQRIKDGDIVNAWISTANRDPIVFKDPEAFDPSRPELGQLLSFGYGLHHCIGDQLAKTEARILITTMLSVLGNLQLQSGSVPQPGHSRIVSGLQSLPITFNVL